MKKPQHYLVTGGAGFIGANLTARLLRKGARVTVFDNLSRSGGASNLRWLKNSAGQGKLTFVRGDLADFSAVRRAAREADCIFHLAGQVAVTTSVADPRKDFTDNALGTFNVLEAVRASGRNPIVLYSSTNKVYGGMDDVKIVERGARYEYAAMKHGISEKQPLDFHSPYGCSKGAADQYMHDYARIFNLRTVVMRQSCIYGYRQFGIEDQGWVAWFIIAALKGRPISIYGDGKQIRDVLFIEDLLDAYELVVANISKTAGKAYNIGGGPRNTMSVWSEFGPMLESLLGRKLNVKFGDWRPGDQKVFVSDIRAAKKDFGWQPKVGVRAGITRLYKWIEANQSLFDHL